MKYVSKVCLSLFCVGLHVCGCNTVENSPVKVQVVSTNGMIESEVNENINEKGEKCLSISLTNRGDTPDSIISIRVKLTPDFTIGSHTETLLGGTCMGRTPVQVSSATDTLSHSGTYMMLNNNDKEYLLIGATTWNIFLPYFRMGGDSTITIEAIGEHRAVASGESLPFEKFVITSGKDWQDMMFDYGRAIAAEHDIKPIKPLNLKGWATWDYYGRVYDNRDITNNVEQLIQSGIDANLIQIDGGWWTSRGDYLSVREDLKGGMKGIADYIKSKGCMPGIHLDGFRADLTSELYQQHPDWFLKDQDGETIFQPIDKGDTFMRYIYFDYSNPEVCQYIKDVMTTIRTEWGFEYFKIDFMRYGLWETIMDLHGPNDKPFEDAAKGVAKSAKTRAWEKPKTVTKINAYANMTSVERTRAGLQAMREGIGDKFFLGCSSIFGPTLGVVDGLRTGGDISPRFEYYMTRVLQNAGNFYLNGTVVQTDADYLVVRNKYDEEKERAWGKDKFGGNTSYDEAQMWSDYVALNGGIKLNSDNLGTLRKERKDLVREAFAYKTATRFLPLDLWEHAKAKDDAFNIILSENEDGVFITLFNWDNHTKRYQIGGLTNAEIYVRNNQTPLTVSGNGTLTYNLKGHSSVILKVGSRSFDNLRRNVTWMISDLQ